MGVAEGNPRARGMAEWKLGLAPGARRAATGGGGGATRGGNVAGMAKPRSTKLPSAQAMARTGRAPQNSYPGAKANAARARADARKIGGAPVGVLKGMSGSYFASKRKSAASAGAARSSGT